jgi:hypothetical protein
MRYRDGSKMGSVMTDRASREARIDAVSRVLKLPEFAYPIRFARWGRLTTFPQWPRLVGPLYEHRMRLSQRIRPPWGVVFGYWRRGERMRAPTSLPASLAVTRAASERGKVDASFQAGTHLLATLSCMRGDRRLLFRLSRPVASWGAYWCRVAHPSVPHSASKRFPYQSVHKWHRSVRQGIIVPTRFFAAVRVLPPVHSTTTRVGYVAL